MGRLLIVSNRLPLTVTRKKDRFEFTSSVGGLATGLSAFLESLKRRPEGSDALWVGWPGLAVEEKEKLKIRARMLREARAHPVFLSEKEMDQFYHGFCNRTLWPLFHLFPSYTALEDDAWEAYRKVNLKFRDAVLEVARPDDSIWVHDYQLMLLPKLLREARPKLSVGFFLHIPFPGFEIFRLLPAQWRRDVLEGLLGADLVGFHTHDYTQAFLRCVLRILGYDHDIGRIVVEDRVIKADTFPMGIDFNRLQEAAVSADVRKEKGKLQAGVKGLKTVLSLDRLDYTKGILNRLEGYERFLEKNPSWLKKVALILVLVPSRTRMESYQRMKAQIDQEIGRINGRFGTIDWTPVLYQYRAKNFTALTALYAASDVALVTPLRDGMNLIAKEYVASRVDGTGVLVLSETAGASRELGEAVLVNPYSTEEIAQSLKEALDMPPEEQSRRLSLMQRRLKQYDVVRWAEDFLQKLQEVDEDQRLYDAKIMGDGPQRELIRAFLRSRRRMLFLDYDGTLVPFTQTPEMARPSSELSGLLKSLAFNPRNELVIVSGRKRTLLEEWFGELPVHLIAEHGAWMKKADGPWFLLKPLLSDWKPRILPLLQASADRLPGAFVEEKEFSLAWHYRMANPEQASMRVKELLDDLVHITATIEVQVIQGSKVIEVRNAGVTKGAAALRFLSDSDPDFVLGVGDDTTDEDLFRILPSGSHSIRVGITTTLARFNLPSHRDVLKVLKSFVEEETPQKRQLDNPQSL